jgi:transaldolase
MPNSAHQAFKQIFGSSRFESMKRRTGTTSLWASTGTKNAAYSDTKYIDALIGKDTVNTVPANPCSLHCLADKGSLERNKADVCHR